MPRGGGRAGAVPRIADTDISVPLPIPAITIVPSAAVMPYPESSTAMQRAAQGFEGLSHANPYSNSALQFHAILAWACYFHLVRRHAPTNL